MGESLKSCIQKKPALTQKGEYKNVRSSVFFAGLSFLLAIGIKAKDI